MAIFMIIIVILLGDSGSFGPLDLWWSRKPGNMRFLYTQPGKRLQKTMERSTIFDG